MVVSVVFTMIIAGVVWLPLILLCLDNIVAQRPVWGPARTLPGWGWARCTGAANLAGHIEITVYTLLVSGSMRSGGWGARLRLAPRPLKPPDQPRALAFAAPGPKGAGAAGGGWPGPGVGRSSTHSALRTGAQQLSQRLGHFDQIVGWAYPWRHALLFLIPNFYGTPATTLT